MRLFGFEDARGARVLGFSILILSLAALITTVEHDIDVHFSEHLGGWEEIGAVEEIEKCWSSLRKMKKGGAKTFGGWGLASLIDKLIVSTPTSMLLPLRTLLFLSYLLILSFSMLRKYMCAS